MIEQIKIWLWRRKVENDFQEKARLCRPCPTFCGDDICQKIGCLNMDMRANDLRLKLLVSRLEDHGYVFISDRKKETPVSNVVNLDDFRK